MGQKLAFTNYGYTVFETEERKVNVEEVKVVPLILRLDVSGQPLGWLNWQGAVVMYAKDRIAWTMGDHKFRVYGGVNRLTRERSFVDINSIIAVKGINKAKRYGTVPPLTNKALFRRDSHLCMYCGREFADQLLTRDHVIPTSKGGRNSWMNTVTACKRCNSFKGDRLLDECSMQLLALPYVPNHAEYIALRNSGRILADQMKFLKPGFTKHCRWVDP